jgi:hypothetical protein
MIYLVKNNWLFLNKGGEEYWRKRWEGKGY